MSRPERFKAIPASYVMFRRGNKILLSLRKNTGYLDGFWSMPSGHVERGESLRQAAIREAKEETGVDIDYDSLELVHTMNRPAKEADGETRLDFFFQTTRWQGEPKNMEPHKCEELKWFDAGKLPDQLVPELRHVIEDIVRGVSESEYGWAEA